MSFSKDVKEELSHQLSNARHCRLAEITAILSCEGRIICKETSYYLKLQTENLVVARKYFTLIRKTFNINIDISVKTNSTAKDNRTYTLVLRDSKAVDLILQATKLTEATEAARAAGAAMESLFQDDRLPAGMKQKGQTKAPSVELGIADPVITQNACCKRAFIRGAFLSSGSMSDPKKAYHFEIVLSSLQKAEWIQGIIQTFSIDAKIVKRKKNYIVYIKEGSQIVDLLNVMEAHVALMDLENVRILKEMRNSINRQVNCEAANINKTVTAASKQIDDIVFIRDNVGLGDLADGLEDIAVLRVEYPEASLKELGAMLLPPIGKSGVNHRLRKLSMIADQLREHKEEKSYDNEGNSN